MYEIYTKKTCPFCRKAKDLLDLHGISYIEYRVDIDLKRKTELLERNPEAKTVPQIFDSDGDLIGGFNDLEEIMDDYGHNM